MDLGLLQQLADDPKAVRPDDYARLARQCRDLAINRLDVRFMVLAECLRSADHFWGPGDSGAVSSDFAENVYAAWAAYVPGILSEESEQAAVTLALALQEELRALGVLGPLDFRTD